MAYKVEKVEPCTKVPLIYNIPEAKAADSDELVSKKIKYHTDYEAPQNLTGHKATIENPGDKELCVSKQCGVEFDGIDGRKFNHHDTVITQRNYSMKENPSAKLVKSTSRFDTDVDTDSRKVAQYPQKLNHKKVTGNGAKSQSQKILNLNKSYKSSYVNVADPAKGRKLNYEELEDRMKTFKLPPQWEGPVEYQSMAEAGFVYTGQEDLVFCFSCNIKLDRWSKDVEPLLRHKEEAPTCSFMQQKLQAVKGERGKAKSVVAPSKPLNSRLTSSIGQLQSSSLVASKSIHTVVTGLNEPRLSYGGNFDDRPGASLPITPENYQSEVERIQSFVGKPVDEAVHPEQLACVGFVYTGDGALVQCFQCGVKYRHWCKGDVPLSVHQKCNPRCSFLQTLVRKSKCSPPEQRLTKSCIQPELIDSNTQDEEVSKHSLQFPDYSDQAIRLQSFKHWGGVLPAYELAEAGFYMIARRDIVRCYSCNVVVQDWERSDNVIGEHKRHSPNCSFLKQFLSSRSNSELLSPLSSINKAGQTSIGKPVIRSNGNNHSSQLSSTMGTSSNTDIKLPPSMKSRSSSESPEDTITGIRYPPSWGQHRSTSPQRTSSNTVKSKDSSKSPDDGQENTITGSWGQHKSPRGTSSEKVKSKQNEKHRNYTTEELPMQSSDRTENSEECFKSSSQSGSSATIMGQCGQQAMENVSPPTTNRVEEVEQGSRPSDLVPTEMRLSALVPGMNNTPVMMQDLPSLHGQTSNNFGMNNAPVMMQDLPSLHGQTFNNFLSEESEQHSSTKIQPKRMDTTATTVQYPPLFGSILPLGSGGSANDDQEDKITGIHYPPSWRQHHSQWASRKISEGSDESFYSAESYHKPDYTMMASLDPPETKIMYEESLSEGLENNISIKTGDTKGDDTRRNLCQICYDKKIDCIFLPCGHARTCEGCATRIKNSGQPCPYCRKGVSATHRIYI